MKRDSSTPWCPACRCPAPHRTTRWGRRDPGIQVTGWDHGDLYIFLIYMSTCTLYTLYSLFTYLLVKEIDILKEIYLYIVIYFFYIYIYTFLKVKNMFDIPFSSSVVVMFPSTCMFANRGQSPNNLATTEVGVLFLSSKKPQTSGWNVGFRC